MASHTGRNRHRPRHRALTRLARWDKSRLPCLLRRLGPFRPRWTRTSLALPTLETNRHPLRIIWSLVHMDRVTTNTLTTRAIDMVLTTHVCHRHPHRHRHRLRIINPNPPLHRQNMFASTTSKATAPLSNKTSACVLLQCASMHQQGEPISTLPRTFQNEHAHTTTLPRTTKHTHIFSSKDL